jgi:hypothetical protein
MSGRARLVLPRLAGELSAQLTEGVFIPADARPTPSTPSTMLRMVPLPRGTGEDRGMP